MNKKLLIFSLSCGLIFCFLFSMVSFSASCEDMYKNIARVRIIANSDSVKDQDVKIEVRDAILKAGSNLFPKEANYDDVISIANENIDLFLKVTEETINKNNLDYSARVEIKEEFFETRVYDDFTLPSGKYKTLVVTLGEGKGQNWWCVMFPSVCVGACSARLEDSINETSADRAYNAEKYVAKFKIIEFYEGVKNFFAKS